MPIYPAGQGVNGLLCPRFLLGCVWLTPSCMCWMLASSSMYCTRWLLCPVYRIAGKCDRIATTLESKQKQSMTIKQENDVSSTPCTSIESTKTHDFHALGAGGREFESRYSDQKKSHDIALEIAFVSWLYLLPVCLKWAGKCDKNATNSEKTCFVRLCAPLFCAVLAIYHSAIMRPVMGWVRYSAPTLTSLYARLYIMAFLFPRLWGKGLSTQVRKRVCAKLRSPNTKKCQHRHKRRWTAPICVTGSKLSVIQLRPPCTCPADSTITEL